MLYKVRDLVDWARDCFGRAGHNVVVRVKDR